VSGPRAGPVRAPRPGLPRATGVAPASREVAYARAMPYRRYLRLEGGCSLALGAALGLVAFPGLVVSYPAAWAAVMFVPGLLAALAGWAWARHRLSPLDPGAWLTTRPLTTARPDAAAIEAGSLTRRVVAETVAWMVAVSLWVLLAGSAGLLVFGTGLASMAFGALQAGAAERRVAHREVAEGTVYRVAQRPALGTPSLRVERGRTGPRAGSGANRLATGRG
jgi:hypothetical protein